ncbi:MAG TPA: hypothetical protein VJT72_09170 [Pseudonocardiaceae bacterium]|nr:hypothetical protein [Pseudonocardiaceae bacterium]
MAPTPSTQPGIDVVATTPTPTADVTLRHLPARTRVWLAQRPHAGAVVDSVWNTLAELDRAGHPPSLLAALRFVLVHHEPNERVDAVLVAG